MISNPLGVVKTRMLMQPTVSRKSVIDTGRDIVNKEGKKVLFTKGLCPSLIGVIHGSIQITIYEFMREKLITSQGKKEPVSKQEITF